MRDSFVYVLGLILILIGVVTLEENTSLGISMVTLGSIIILITLVKKYWQKKEENR